MIAWIGVKPILSLLKEPHSNVGLFLFMKEYAKKFYSSKQWQRCRTEYKKSVGGLCERCLKDGIIRSGEIVHHKEYINPDNITDPSILLNFDNLELLCREHHEREHRRKKGRYDVDELGRVITRED